MQLSVGVLLLTAVRIPPELCQLHPLTQNAYLAARLGPYLVWWFFGLLRAMELRGQIVHPQLTPARCTLTSASLIKIYLGGLSCSASDVWALLGC